MPYTPSAYTTRTIVQRLLRTQNNRIKFGDNPNDGMTLEDLDEYILDASRFIDGMITKYVRIGAVPLTGSYPEIQYAAGRLTAFFIFRDFFGAYRVENLPMGPRGWSEDAKDSVKRFIDNLNEGMYPTISLSSGAPAWETAEQFFQTKIGVSCVNDMVANTSDTAPTMGDNIGPYTD